MNKELEKKVLGGIILDNEIQAELRYQLDPELFACPKHRMIAKTIKFLINSRLPVDFISMSDTLRAFDRLDEVGGSKYIADMVNNAATIAEVREALCPLTAGVKETIGFYLDPCDYAIELDAGIVVYREGGS